LFLYFLISNQHNGEDKAGRGRGGYYGIHGPGKNEKSPVEFQQKNTGIL
jgi:hypothetical protein